MTKAIIFDWAGVLASDGYWVWLRKNVEDIEDRKEFFHKISEDVDSAKISHDEFLEKLSLETGRLKERVWDEIKKEIIINKDLISFVKKLKARYKVGLLSNFTHPWLSEIIAENNLWGLFDRHIISSEHKMVKPDPRIFQKILDMLGVKPEEAVFIDDRKMHTDGAKRVGLRTILFIDNVQLIEDLRGLGVEV
ncbi:MAG: HAD family phosphatase [Candidatus Liptonbacteria bacterium]